MKAVNAATRMVAEMFQRRAADLPFEEHPYSQLLKAQKIIGKTEWTPDLRQQAISALGVWIMSIFGNSVSGTMNEILDLMRIANDLPDEKAKNAAKEMSGSMPFLEKIVTIFVNEVDVEYVAETLFDDGVRLEKERAGETTSDVKPTPKTTIQNWTPARWNPSAN